MTATDIRFGILGTGMIARYHAAAIAATEGARLAAVARADKRGVAEAAAAFGVPCEAGYDALLSRDDVDVVCICTPSGLHAPQALAAARAGKHVLVEKPMALTLPDADAMIAACRERGVLLAVALQRRTEPAFIAVRDAVRQGALGRLTLGSVIVPYLRTQSYYASAAWRGTWELDGGGALMNQGIHLVDLLLWLMGEVGDVEGVQARAATLAHDIPVEDVVAATLRFAGGALGSVVATTAAAPGFPHRVEVYGDGGGIQIEGEAVARWDAATPRPPEAPAPDAPSAAGPGASPGGISAAGHTRIVADLVAAIRAGRPPLVPGEEGRRSLAVVRAIYEAAGVGPARA
jgi:predicted dehydrogenase